MRVLIREGWESDLDWMVIQMVEFAKFFGTRHSLFGDEQFIRLGLTNLIKNHFVRVATGCNDVGFIDRMGFIIGIVTPHPYNPAIKVLSEQFFWVEPKYRGSRAALMLLDVFVAFGKKRANWITMTTEVNGHMNSKALLRRGFAAHEINHLLEVA